MSTKQNKQTGRAESECNQHMSCKLQRWLRFIFLGVLFTSRTAGVVTLINPHTSGAGNRFKMHSVTQSSKPEASRLSGYRVLVAPGCRTRDRPRSPWRRVARPTPRVRRHTGGSTPLFWFVEVRLSWWDSVNWCRVWWALVLGIVPRPSRGTPYTTLHNREAWF